MSKGPSPYSSHSLREFTMEEFEQDAAAFDRVVAVTPDVDPFCSSSRWIIPAAKALMADREPWIFQGASGRVAMMRGRHPEGWHYLEPLEASWGLACPLAGPDADGLAAEFVTLCHQRRSQWNVMLLMGLPEGSLLFKHVAQRLHPYYDLFRGQVTRRKVASLAGGVDGFLGRRTRNFRKALGKSLRKAEAAGIEFHRCDVRSKEQAEALYQRIIAIETASWKGQDGLGVGIDVGLMREFYALMVPMLARRGELRTIIAQHEGRDVAYVLGGICGRQYRGLQFSFVADHAAYSLGNLCQYHQIVDLAEEGVETYDLGTDMEYKRRWAELDHDTVALIVYKRNIL